MRRLAIAGLLVAASTPVLAQQPPIPPVVRDYQGNKITATAIVCVQDPAANPVVLIACPGGNGSSGGSGGNGTSSVASSQSYTAMQAGPGYAVGDVLANVVNTNPGTGAYQSGYWVNVTQHAVLANAPSLSNLTQLPVAVSNFPSYFGARLQDASGNAFGTSTNPLIGNMAQVGGATYGLGPNVAANSAPVTLATDGVVGAKTDAACTTSDATACSGIALWKESVAQYAQILQAYKAAGTTATTGLGVQGMTGGVPLVVSGQVAAVVTPTAVPANGVAPVATTAPTSCQVFKSGAGNLYGVSLYSSATGWFLFFDAATTPTNGAVSPVEFVRYPVADVTLAYAAPGPLAVNNGATICFSTTGPYTLTTSATATISAKVK